MRINWTPLRAELALWRAARMDLPLWWRDDDAITCTPALERLTALSTRMGLPVHLAIIPEMADETLAHQCLDGNSLIPMVHGWAHKNHAPGGAKKAEFGHPRPGLVADAERGLARLRGIFGPSLLPVFVPPWNRIHFGLMAELAKLGYRGVSTFTPRKGRMAAPGLVQINTHIDPIHWRGGGGLLQAETLVAQVVETLAARRVGAADRAEPLGILTHHLVHDAAIWAFTQALIEELLEGGARAVNLRDTDGELP